MSENQEEHASMDGFGADEEDADFQAALLLSMQSVSQEGEPTPAQPSGSILQASDLQQALLQAMGQTAAQQPQAQAGPSGAAHSPAATQAAQPATSSHIPVPAWYKSATSWPGKRAKIEPSQVPMPAQQALGPFLSSIFGVQVTLSGAEQNGSLSLSWLANQLRRVPPGENTVLAIQQCWTRAAEAAQQPDAAGMGEAVAMVQRAAALWATELLLESEDDLFFEGGKEMELFLQALADGRVAPAFLDAMVIVAQSPKDHELCQNLLDKSFRAVKQLPLDRPETHEPVLRRLDILTQSPAVREFLAVRLLREARLAASGVTGSILEPKSMLAPLLACSALPVLGNRIFPLTFPAKGCFLQLRNYPRNRGSQVETELVSIRRVLQRTYSAAHEICKRIATVKPEVAKGANGKEALPAWLAMIAESNVRRTDAGSYLDKVLLHKGAMRDSASDAFLMGCLAVSLRFCRPFMATAEKKVGALANLSPQFYTTHAHRVRATAREITLAGNMPKRPKVYPALSPDGTAPAHFVAEMFFATQQLVHVGLVPTIHRVRALARELRRRGKAPAGGGAEEEFDPAQGSSLEEWLLADSVHAVLADPDLGNDLVQFCELTALWLLSMLQGGEEAAATAVALVPESVVRDMCTVLSFLISERATEVLGGADISVLMQCLTTVLRSTHLIPSPAVHNSIVQLLVAMLSPQLASASGRRRAASPAEAALVSAVLGTGATQTDLLPALMTAYVQADHVVGLDVDKDAYDKFHLRSCCDVLLMELWRDPTCAASLSAVAAGGRGEADVHLFSDFCGAVVNDLVYLLKDSLGRLEDISALERSMADEAAWGAQPPEEREKKLVFYRAQQSTAKGFLFQALTTLSMLNTLVTSSAVQTGFLTPEVAPKAAGATFHFLDLLVGPRCAELAVNRPEQYHFNPDSLLLSVLHFMLRLAEQPAFVGAMAEVPDYDEVILVKAVEVLATKQLGEYEHRVRLEGLAGAVAARRSAALSPTTHALEAVGLGGEPAAVDAAQLDASYAAALTPLAVGEFDASQPRAYNRHFAAMADAAAGDVSAASKRLGREIRDLRGKMALPVYAAGAIFVRHDGARLDKMRACITGPEGTPYEGGMFFFDVLFPQRYPDVPPLMELETTGMGTARFNPNLYADGKVCLSLLGTWHGGGQSEKWNPKTSTLWQVLVSIQSMIFVPEPYYNEPAYEGMRGTKEGDAASLKYNAELWLATMRHANIDVLKNPRPGFEEAITAHFRILRPVIQRRVAQWVQQAEPLGESVQGRLQRAATELQGLLAAL